MEIKTTSIEIILRYPYPFVKGLALQFHERLYLFYKFEYTLPLKFCYQNYFSIFLGITLTQALTCENFVPNAENVFLSVFALQFRVAVWRFYLQLHTTLKVIFLSESKMKRYVALPIMHNNNIVLCVPSCNRCQLRLSEH